MGFVRCMWGARQPASHVCVEGCLDCSLSPSLFERQRLGVAETEEGAAALQRWTDPLDEAFLEELGTALGGKAEEVGAVQSGDEGRA